jgi:telomerase Cajal body protein 1
MESQDGKAQGKVKLVASTGDIVPQHFPPSPSSAIRGIDYGEEAPHGVCSYFENAQWTADGTTVLTYSSTHLVSGYILPEDLLSEVEQPHTLQPQADIQLPEPSNVLSGAPYFSLAEPWTQQVLVSARDHPLQLFYLSPSSEDSQPPIASYPFTKARSEDFLAATSLLWPTPGTHFIAGNRNFLARFDVQRTGEEPVNRIRTIPSERHLSKGGGVGMRGIVSALGGQPMNRETGASLVAAGTWTRWVGLYDFAQAGNCVATWSIAAAVKETGNNGETSGIGGDGITQTIWSPCGRYLMICERKSRGALIYDVRVTGKLLGYLTGRNALGNQRVSCDVFPGADENVGFEVWSGTSNGDIKVWEGVGNTEGPYAPAWAWDAHHSTVGSACLHPSGSVVATCAGSWEFADEENDSGHYGPGDRHLSSQSSSGSSDDDSSGAGTAYMNRRNRESSLKVWSLAGLPTKIQTQPVEEGV